MNKRNRAIEEGYKLLLQELKENPLRKFNLAFTLMVVIPFLAFLYLLAGKLFSFDILISNTGAILFLSLFIALCGFFVGYGILKNILNKIIFYAAQAKHSDQLKSTFVANVSHELKNPLSSVKLNIFNLFQGLVGKVSEEQKKILELCHSVIERMNRLITELLDLHKVEAGMVSVNRGLCDLLEISEKQIKELDALAGRKNVKINKDFLNETIYVWGDEDKLAQVINNLLNNAIKFTYDGKAITLKIQAMENFARIECEDCGPGIPSDRIGRLFNKFERLDAEKEGTGLGLVITKDIVEMHKGKIWVESQAGKGSNFIVVLPRDLRSVSRKNNGRKNR